MIENIGEQVIDTKFKALNETKKYSIDKTIFIVESEFKKDSKDTLGNVLLRLMTFNEKDEKN